MESLTIENVRLDCSYKNKYLSIRLNMSNISYPIVFASDENGATLLGVSLFSLLQNANPATVYTVYILDTGLSEKSRQKIESLTGRFDFNLEIINALPVIEQYIKNPTIISRWPLAAYARLFAHRLLPEKEKIIAYLDIDTLVCTDLGELFKTDMAGKPLAAVFYEPEIFNSGVLLMNLDYFRATNYEETLSQFEGQTSTNYQGHNDFLNDQQMLNLSFAENTVRLHPRWNWKSNYEVRLFRGKNAIEKHLKAFHFDEAVEACVDPGIIHYMDLQKPPRRPHTFNGDIYRKVWLQSPWNDSPELKLNLVSRLRYFLNYLKAIYIRRSTKKIYRNLQKTA